MKRTIPKLLKKGRKKKQICCVLITCEAPTDDGLMRVEMTYKGEESLVAYLLLGAQDFIEDEQVVPQPISRQDKIAYLEMQQ